MRIILILASLGFLAYLMRNVSAVFAALSTAELAPVVLASIILVTAIAWTAFLWTRLVGHLTRGYPRPSTKQLLRSFSRSWIARYLPGTGWAYGTRVIYTDRAEVPTHLLATALIDEFILIITTTVGLGVGFWVWARAGAAVGLATLTIAFGLAILAVTQASRMAQVALASVGGALSRRWKRAADELALVAETPRLELGVATLFSVGYGLISLSGAIAFALLADSLGSVRVQDLPAIIGGYNLAVVMGVLAVFAPAGVGVREALLAAFLSSVITAPVAAFAAIAFRALTLVADLLFFTVVEAVTFRDAKSAPPSHGGRGGVSGYVP